MGEGLAVFNEPIGSIRMVSFQFRSSQLAAVLVYMSSLVTNGIREAVNTCHDIIVIHFLIFFNRMMNWSYHCITLMCEWISEICFSTAVSL